MMHRPRTTRMLHLVAVPTAIVIGLILTGCGTSNADNPTITTPTAAPAPTGTPSPTPTTVDAPPPAAESTMTPIVIELGDQQLQGSLDASAASASLIAQLPLTLSFRDYGGQEKVAELPAPLNLEGAPAGSDAAPSTIGYYTPDQRLILYYDQVGYFPGIVPLGTFENAAAVEGQTGDFTVTIRRAN